MHIAMSTLPPLPRPAGQGLANRGSDDYVGKPDHYPLPRKGDAPAKAVPLVSVSSNSGAEADEPLYRLTVTRRKVAGIDVASSLVFCLLNKVSSSAWSSASRPFAAAASNAFMVGP